MPRDWKIICMTTLAACAYGVAHDEFTIRVCTEYFTVAHAPIFRIESITILALYWGMAATAPFGLAFGFILARVSSAGGEPATPLRHLDRGIVRLLMMMACTAPVAGAFAYYLTQRGWLSLPRGFAHVVEACTAERFMAAWFAHAASYLVGTFGATTLCFRIWRQRGSPPALTIFPKTPGAIVRTILVLFIGAFVFYLRFAHH